MDGRLRLATAAANQRRCQRDSPGVSQPHGICRHQQPVRGRTFHRLPKPRLSTRSTKSPAIAGTAPLYTGIELRVSAPDRRSAVNRGLHARISAHRRHVAAQRSGRVHPARCVCQRQGHRQRVRRALSRPRQPERIRRRVGAAVAGPRASDRSDVSGAVAPGAGDHLQLSERHMVRSNRHAPRRTRSTIRAAAGDTVQRSRRIQSGGDDDSLRACDARRRPVRAARHPCLERSHRAAAFSIPALRSRVQAAVDVYNVLNLAGDHLVSFGANQLYNPSFGIGGARQLPRSAAFSFRLSF